MLERWQRAGNLDRLGIWISSLCAVHCLVTAVALALLSSAAGVLGNPHIHEYGLAMALVLGIVTIGHGALKHGYLMPIAVGSLGIGVMAGALSLPHGGEEIIFTIFGVGLLAIGHDLNRRAFH